MSRAIVNRMIHVLMCLFFGMFVVLCPFRVGAEEASRTLSPPQALIEAGLLPMADAKLSERAAMTWQQVQDAVQPTPWPEAKPKPAGALSLQGAGLVEQAEAQLAKGEVFRAIQLLRQAEQSDPAHPRVKRALGMAYAESGNLTRASSYLHPIATARRDDVEALLVLMRNAAQSESLERVLMYSLALETTGATSLLADSYRSVALHRLGYTAAATDRQAATVKAIDGFDFEQAGEDVDAPAVLRRELRVLQAMHPQLRIELGDLYLQSGQYDKALNAYADVTLQDPAARHLLGARRVYLAMLTEQPSVAMNQVIALLAADDATDSDAALVDYLVEQGIAAEALAMRISELLAKQGVNHARLLALASAAEKQVVLEQIGAWLSTGPVTVDRLKSAVSLVRFDDDVPADGKPLAELLVLIAERIAQTPDQALKRARIAVQGIGSPVSLLRALKAEAFTAASPDMQRLFSAVIYEETGRQRDALQAYRELMQASEDRLVQSALLPFVRLELAVGNPEQAKEKLGEPTLDTDWPMFDLSLRAMSATGQSREAIAIIDEYIKANGRKLESDVLRIELIAQMGQPQEACNLLLRLISSNPNEESLYHLGIDLSYDYRDSFNRLTDADRMRRAFLTRLISNLPESPLARVGMAQNIRSNPSRIDEAVALLLEVLEEEPSNTLALSLLVELYEDTGDELSAEAAHDRYAMALGPGMSRALLIAGRAVSNGKMNRAKQVLDDALKLDEQGVLPGPAMTGDQASMLLRHLEAADPDRDTDALYVSMVRRFPDDAQLNNALGYRWTVENKNLWQAEAMIKRALQQEPTNHSLLDSLAWVQYKLGDFETAYTTQSRALMVLETQLARFNGLEREMGATIAILNDHMGDILYKLDDRNKALKHWREAMKQGYTEEEKLFDPELRSLEARLKAKVDALADDRPVPVADVPGPESYGPKGHPAEIEPEDKGPDA